MIRFNNDYNRGALKCVLDAVSAANGESFPGYGEDGECEKARGLIRDLVASPDAQVMFFPGATQANFVVVNAALSSVQSVVAADTGHINCHEAASIEHTGHKILSLQNTDGKITAKQIEACAEEYSKSGEAEYLTEPKMVYLSFPTEKGTLYSKEELSQISAVCKKFGMYLFVDGARLGYGLTSVKNDLTAEDFGRLCDVFYFGGTKCGALFGEAVVITNEKLKRRFKAYMKQSGAVLAKGWLLGLQFSALFESGEYFAAAKRANEFALELKEAFLKKGIPFWVESFTNQQFVILSEEQKKKLSEKYCFEIEGETELGTIARFCTSWATTREEIEALKLSLFRL